MEKVLIILRGLPGAGKTTAAKVLAEDKYNIFSNDDYFYVNGKYIYNKEHLRLSQIECYNNIKNDMINNAKKIFVHNTFIKTKSIKQYYKLAEEYGYDVITLIVENRKNNKDVHSVIESDLEAMKKNFNIKL